ncbi:hypothetical protein, partial [Salmonella enterica]
NTVLKEAQKRRPNASISEEIIISREIRTLESIQKKYGLTSDDELLINKGKTSNREIIPDREIGFLGEKVVYEEEINYAI